MREVHQLLVKACTRLVSIEVQSTLSPAAELIFTIYGKTLPRKCEAKDNELTCTLIFIDESLGYKIGNINYVKYLLLTNNML